jgi:glycosyltransferase involved in cell wall biosynthesis
MPTPEISIIVCTYQRPANLRRVLASIAGQRGVEGRFEVVVADDGSIDETPEVVASFRKSVRFPVHFTTHPHGGFCPGRARNEGVAASRGEYVLLLDGDCLLPRNHVRIQLAKRRPGVVRVGDSIRLAEGPSAGVSENFAARGRLARLASLGEHWRILARAGKSTFYNLRRHPDRPRLIANNVALWKKDYERVNGFDQSYVGWGAEDDDFGFRLRRAGLQLRTILWWTTCYHLWHPRDPSAPAGRTGGDNYQYLNRGFHLIKCGHGLARRTWQDLSIAAASPLPPESVLRQIFPAARPRFLASGPAEVELLFTPGPGIFSGRAQCNVLVACDAKGSGVFGEQTSSMWKDQFRQRRRAPSALPSSTLPHLILCDQPLASFPAQRQFRISQWEDAMDYLMFNRTPTEQPGKLHLPAAA